MAGVEDEGDCGRAGGGPSAEGGPRRGRGGPRLGAGGGASGPDNLRAGGGVNPSLATPLPPGAASAGPGPAGALSASVGAAASRPRQSEGAKGGADEPQRSLALGTRFLLMGSGDRDVKEPYFIFFPFQPQSAK